MSAIPPNREWAAWPLRRCGTKIMFNVDDKAYEPFIRTDQYGHLGLVPQSSWEYTRLAVLSVTVVPLKTLGSLLCLVTFYVICRISDLLPKHIRDQVVPRTGKVCCRALLLCIGFLHVRWRQIHVDLPRDGQHPTNGDIDRTTPAIGIVSNHVGWVDILVHMTRFFPSFVARKATRDLVMVGLIRCLPSASILTSLITLLEVCCIKQGFQNIACTCRAVGSAGREG